MEPTIESLSADVAQLKGQVQALQSHHQMMMGQLAMMQCRPGFPGAVRVPAPPVEET